MTLTLVGLAAGMGSRFGGPKQLEPLGPEGETMLDFSIHDALRAGFERVVLVIQPAMHEVFERGVAARWRPRVPVQLVHQVEQLIEESVRHRAVLAQWFARREVVQARPVDAGWFVSEGFKPGEKIVVAGAQLLLSEELKSKFQTEE